MVTQSVVWNNSVGIATRYGLDGPGIETWWGKFSVPVQTGPGAHPASYNMGIGSFPRIKRVGRGVNHPSPPSAEAKNTVELYLYALYAPSWQVIGKLYRKKSISALLCII